MTIPPISVSLSMGTTGKVTLGERGEKRDDGGWTSVELACVENEEIRLYFDLDTAEVEGETAISLYTSASHVANEDDSRAFHTHMDATLSVEQARILWQWLGFILEAADGP